jgi:hypothetical protein
LPDSQPVTLSAIGRTDEVLKLPLVGPQPAVAAKGAIGEQPKRSMPMADGG